MLNILLAVLLVVIVFAAIFWLVGKAPLDPGARKLVQGILAAIGIVVLLLILFGRMPLPAF